MSTGAKRLLAASESRSSTAVSCCRRRFPRPEEGPRLSERSERVGRTERRAADSRSGDRSWSRSEPQPSLRQDPPPTTAQQRSTARSAPRPPRSADPGPATRCFACRSTPLSTSPVGAHPDPRRPHPEPRPISRSPLLVRGGRRVLRRGAVGRSRQTTTARAASAARAPAAMALTALAQLRPLLRTWKPLRAEKSLGAPLSLAGSSRFAPGGQAPHCVRRGARSRLNDWIRCSSRTVGVHVVIGDDRRQRTWSSAGSSRPSVFMTTASMIDDGETAPDSSRPPEAIVPPCSSPSPRCGGWRPARSRSPSGAGGGRRCGQAGRCGRASACWPSSASRPSSPTP